MSPIKPGEKLLKIDGRLATKDGKLVATSAPEDCDCCGDTNGFCCIRGQCDPTIKTKERCEQPFDFYCYSYCEPLPIVGCPPGYEEVLVDKIPVGLCVRKRPAPPDSNGECVPETPIPNPTPCDKEQFVQIRRNLNGKWIEGEKCNSVLCREEGVCCKGESCDSTVPTAEVCETEVSSYNCISRRPALPDGSCPDWYTPDPAQPGKCKRTRPVTDCSECDSSRDNKDENEQCDGVGGRNGNVWKPNEICGWGTCATPSCDSTAPGCLLQRGSGANKPPEFPPGVWAGFDLWGTPQRCKPVDLVDDRYLFYGIKGTYNKDLTGYVGTPTAGIEFQWCQDHPGEVLINSGQGRFADDPGQVGGPGSSLGSPQFGLHWDWAPGYPAGGCVYFWWRDLVQYWSFQGATFCNIALWRWRLLYADCNRQEIVDASDAVTELATPMYTSARYKKIGKFAYLRSNSTSAAPACFGALSMGIADIPSDRPKMQCDPVVASNPLP